MHKKILLLLCFYMPISYPMGSVQPGILNALLANIWSVVLLLLGPQVEDGRYSYEAFQGALGSGRRPDLQRLSMIPRGTHSTGECILQPTTPAA